VAEVNAINSPLALPVGEQLLIPVNLPLTGPEDPAPSASIEGVTSLALTQSTRTSH
jgi:hypothetical protein